MQDTLTCSVTDPWIIVLIICAAVSSICPFLVRIGAAHKPTPGRTFWGFPSAAALLFFNVASWSFLPQIVFFIFFHEIAPHMFTHVKSAACVVGENFSYFSAVMFVNGLMFTFLYSTSKIVDQLGGDIADDRDLPHGPAQAKVLLFGSICNGRLAAVRLGAQNRQHYALPAANINSAPDAAPLLGTPMCREVAETEVACVTDLNYAHSRNNLETTGIVKASDESTFMLLQTTETSEGLFFQIPRPNDTYDKIIMSPLVRKGPPLGGFSAPEEKTMVAMKRVWLEVLRVLKPGGVIRVVDSLQDALLLQADLKDILPPNSTRFEESPDRFGGLPKFSFAKASVYAQKPVNFIVPHVAIPVESKDPNEHLPHLCVYITACAFQLVVYVALMMLAAGTYSPLNVPDSVDVNNRATNLVLSVCNGFPMIAYFMRQSLVHRTFSSATELLVAVVPNTLMSVVGSIAFTVVFSLPTFLVELALHKTSVNQNVISAVGKVITIGIALWTYKKAKSAGAEKAFKLRGIDMSYVKRL